MKRLLIFIISILTIFAQSIIAEDFSTADVTVKFYNKTLYYPELVKDNPIWVHITIANRGTNTLRFKLADDRNFSLDFNVFTPQNKKLTQTDSIVRKRTTNQTVYFREIALEPGEEYSFIENLKEYIVINNPAMYYFEVNFYPELYKSKMTKIVSNRLSLEIKPSTDVVGSTKLAIESDTGSILQPENLSPDNVVYQTIVARQKSLWDQFFLYIDIEEMYLRDPIRARKYRNESALSRTQLLQNYKLDLSQSMLDNDIIALPSKFEIEKTVYTKLEGTVTVLEWFNYTNFTEKKRYTYYLKQRDGIWKIYDYTVDNLGTE
ncbi:MAG: hypothetical protein BKP49_01930 [Treponema sp. CETP13]|nr:MAG: hypothetical protein BKP49_01930 [Treponema sp. CETP13]